MAAHADRRQARGVRQPRRGQELEAPRLRAAARARMVHGEATGDGADSLDPVGLYFGTTGGEVWASFDEGAAWHCLCLHLPHVYSVETARAD